MAEQPAVAADIRDGAKPGHKERDRTARADVSYTEATRETTLERFRRHRAAEALRLALAPHQPVVKRCVAERLCRHKPTARLARELGLTEDQVREILERMRPWVHRFTTYFDSDWFWQDDGMPFLPGATRT